MENGKWKMENEGDFLRIINSAEIKKSFFEQVSFDVSSQVGAIIKKVRKYGDSAVFGFTKEFDGVQLKKLEVEKAQIESATKKLSNSEFEAIWQAKKNIEIFSKAQRKAFSDFEIETQKGVFCSQRVIPVGSACVYVPGGNYPLPSSVLMGVVPAKVANVKRIIVCTPPNKDGQIHPAILAACKMCDVDEVYKVGGAQAIAAAAFGTESIAPVDIIVGPGNAYVAEAKRQVFGRVGIDFVAGPSEILIIADESGDADLIAADLLAQAEHDVNASAILLTISPRLAKAVSNEVESQLKGLQTKKIAEVSIKNNGLVIVVKSLDEAVTISNKIAPEHLELFTKKETNILPKLSNYGSVFWGVGSCEAMGDYAAGLNHILPTAGSARYSSGLSVKHFLKLATGLRVTRAEKVGKSSMELAKLEGLDAHRKSVEMRLHGNGELKMEN